MAVATAGPAYKLWFLSTGIVFLFFLLFAFYTDSIKSPLDYAHAKAAEFCSDSAPQTTAEADPKDGKFGNCKDPYRRPGYLYVPAETERYRETRWMPFTDKFLNSEDPETAEYPHTGGDLIFNDTDVPRTFFKGSDIPIEWMKLAVKENKRRKEAMAHITNATSEDYHRMRNDAEFGWLWGRRVVSFGDSIDRRAARYVCHEFGHDMEFPKLHEIEQWPMGVCHIPAFNLTFTAFHSAGGFTYRPEWFWYKQMRIIPFERRWEELWQPHERDIRGPNGRPDLILWQNGLWDQRGFQVGGQKLHEGQNVTLNGRHRKMVWDELHFFLARTKKYAEMLIKEFPDTPMMWRSLTYHQKTGSGDIMVVEMDRLGRALAEQYGHEVFEWGRIISLMGSWYEDGTHPGEGALTWLWGTMILEYLARSAKSKLGGDYRFPYFDGWERCHEELVGWGGR
ncbi:hypothetical protein FPCIR_6728 [Fusarium pseudocircinatum]|uniref:Uncharacterized protein n=1 Tax=Fusarium pseudocircinatum TaxID=56676 RepID=A0A8H5P6C3_9HYPO|nr:hypothetical protein FPCIR_6728 [Fusarium pseudocircinatum]